MFQCSQAVEVPEGTRRNRPCTSHNRTRLGADAVDGERGTQPAGEMLDGEDGGPETAPHTSTQPGRRLNRQGNCTLHSHCHRPSLATARTQNQLLPGQKAEAECSDSADSSKSSGTWRQEQHRCFRGRRVLMWTQQGFDSWWRFFLGSGCSRAFIL